MFIELNRISRYSESLKPENFRNDLEIWHKRIPPNQSIYQQNFVREKTSCKAKTLTLRLAEGKNVNLWGEDILHTSRDAKSKDFKPEIKQIKMGKIHILFKIENDL